MIVYGSQISPFVRKVLVVAAEKGIEVEMRAGGARAATPDFLEASPFRKIPALRDGDFTLADSTAIVTYMEAVAPEPALIPAEAKARGRTIWFDEFADTILFAAGVKIVFNRFVAPLIGMAGDEEAAARAEREELPPILDYLEGVVDDCGFLVGGSLTLADIAVASPFASMLLAGTTVDGARHPRLARYLEGIFARESFATLIAGDRRLIAG